MVTDAVTQLVELGREGLGGARRIRNGSALCGAAKALEPAWRAC